MQSARTDAPRLRLFSRLASFPPRGCIARTGRNCRVRGLGIDANAAAWIVVAPNEAVNASAFGEEYPRCTPGSQPPPALPQRLGASERHHTFYVSEFRSVCQPRCYVRILTMRRTRPGPAIGIPTSSRRGPRLAPGADPSWFRASTALARCRRTALVDAMESPDR